LRAAAREEKKRLKAKAEKRTAAARGRKLNGHKAVGSVTRKTKAGSTAVKTGTAKKRSKPSG
jgi:hypothetical protein